MKMFKNYVFVILACVAVAVGCSKDKDKPSGTSHKVVVKAEVSSGSVLNNAHYGTEVSGTTATGLTSTTWTSPEFTVPAGTQYVTGSAGGEGLNAAATIKVQIYVDGALKKEGTGSGTGLAAVALYEF
uniref:hypothetical protein n=1 Tax=Pedobacter schmidteae TaxID=2201271 RepID=UPI000EB15AA8|nr:hypothetical protein [Pedobacter schmidteae]